MSITTLSPRPVWRHFADLNAIPRASKKEARVIEFMRTFGEKLGLPTRVDDAGNVVIKKPATPGMEDRQTVILQSHLDMVHQKNADTDFDFDTEGIRSYVDGDWVKAEGTTLGADNGIGVAAIMALLESTDISHPPLEALFTIDEETGMTGAKGLAEDLLSGSILLNLDSEEDDELTIGCAGGIDTSTSFTYDETAAPGGADGLRITVKGLRGGHSGMDIHKGRGNANKLLTRLLFRQEGHGLRLAAFDGGGLRNAIPREAFALVAVPVDQKEALMTELAERTNALKREYQSVEPNLTIAVAAAEAPAKVMAEDHQKRVLNALYAMPNGVFRMSPDIPDLVETSSNLARVIIRDGQFQTHSLQRSSVESGKVDILNAIEAVFHNLGAEVAHAGDYPGWAPDPQSPILEVMEKNYTELFGEAPHVAACHAGLECGIIGRHYPGLDMISFGPTIRHAHSPDEMVNIQSVEKFWKYLLATLEQIPGKN